MTEPTTVRPLNLEALRVQILDEAADQHRRLIISNRRTFDRGGVLEVGAATMFADEIFRAQVGHPAWNERSRSVVEDLVRRILPKADSWWLTHLGDALAGACGPETNVRWTYQTAALYLGVDAADVAELVCNGELEADSPYPSPHGTVVPASCVAHRARMHPTKNERTSGAPQPSQ